MDFLKFQIERGRFFYLFVFDSFRIKLLLTKKPTTKHTIGMTEKKRTEEVKKDKFGGLL